MGLRGPAPKSRDQKVLAGTFRKDRDHGATIAPAPLSEVPKAPSWLSTLGKAEWRRMAAELITLNALGAIDLGDLTGYCAAYARAVAAEQSLARHGKQSALLERAVDKALTVFLADPANDANLEALNAARTEAARNGALTMLTAQGVIPRSEVNVAKVAWAEMRAFASKLGASPADRTRVKPLADPKPQRVNDPWEGLATDG